jgi:hypothetical protein
MGRVGSGQQLKMKQGKELKITPGDFYAEKKAPQKSDRMSASPTARCHRFRSKNSFNAASDAKF